MFCNTIFVHNIKEIQNIKSIKENENKQQDTIIHLEQLNKELEFKGILTLNAHQ